MIDLDELKGKIEAAHKMVSELCSGKKKWIMSIPVQPDEDPDIVIGDGLRAGGLAIKTACELQARVAELEGYIDEHNNRVGALPAADRAAIADVDTIAANLREMRLLEENEQFRGALSDIFGLSIDYDGYREASSLMQLIDEIRDIAKSGKPLPMEQRRALAGADKESEG